MAKEVCSNSLTHSIPMQHGTEDNRDNNVQRAWLQGMSGEGVTVAVVDDGTSSIGS